MGTGSMFRGIDGRWPRLAGMLIVSFLNALFVVDIALHFTQPDVWSPRYDERAAFDAGTTLQLLDFIEKKKLTDKRYEAELYRHAVEECKTCGIEFEGLEQARSVLRALATKGAVERFRLWHRISQGSMVAILVLSLVVLLGLWRSRKRGMTRFLRPFALWLPFQVALLGVAGMTEDIRLFTGPLPTPSPDCLKAFAFAGVLAVLGWPFVAWRRSLDKRLAVASSGPNPWNRYRSPREKLRDAKRQAR